MTRDLTGMFSPRSIAVIGASQTAQKVGAIALKNIIISGYKGRIYPINPKITTIGALKFYPDITSLPEIPDLAVIAIPANLVINELEKGGKHGVKNFVIFTAGFKEIGDSGLQLEKQLIDVATRYQLNILGPNCLGFASTAPPLNVTFGQVIKDPGNLRLISQSGAIAASLFDWCQTTTLGFNDFITVGNKSVVNENDILSHWLPQLSQTLSTSTPGLSSVIPVGLYLESISNGQELVKIISQITPHHPVFILKPGKSPAAAAAMRSHTGAIAGEDRVLDAALTQSGAIRCQELGDFFDLSQAFAWENAPLGPQVAVISNAGGPAVLTTDTIAELGLEMAKLSPETKQKLLASLPRIASIINPIDVLGDALADRFGQALEIVLQDQAAQAIVVILTPQLMTQIEKTAKIIGQLSLKYPQPILCSFIGGNHTINGQKILNQCKIPTYPYPERAIKTIASMWNWQKWRQNHRLPSTIPPVLPAQDDTKKMLTDALAANQTTLDNQQADLLLSAFDIPTPPTNIINSLEEVNQFTQKNGWPIVLKLSSSGLLHKSDVGGVITNIKSSSELTNALNQLTQKITELSKQYPQPMKVQVQKQIDTGVEVILGVKRDPTFGSVLLFGAGGKYAEILDDHNLWLLPLSQEDATRLVEHSKVYKLLSGFRDDPPYRLDQLYEIMVCLSQLVNEYPQIAEIEINPLIITHHGVWAVDPKVLLTPPLPSAPATTAGPNFKIAKTISHTVLADKFHYFVFETTTPLNFNPGQYISIQVGPQRINSYSIAGTVNSHQIEILVDTSPEGIGSHYFENLKEGEEVKLLGPFGNFSYKPDNNVHELVFLGTGSGIAPLRCIIKSLLQNDHLTTPMTLYFGLRYQTDLFWQQEFESLTSQYPNFHFKLSLSKPDDSWTGLKGHITDHLVHDFPDCSKVNAYLCGGQAMIKEARQLLTTAGCPDNHIYQEKFD